MSLNFYWSNDWEDHNGCLPRSLHNNTVITSGSLVREIKNSTVLRMLLTLACMRGIAGVLRLSGDSEEQIRYHIKAMNKKYQHVLLFQIFLKHPRRILCSQNLFQFLVRFV